MPRRQPRRGPARRHHPVWPTHPLSVAAYGQEAIASPPKPRRATGSLTPAEARVLVLLATYRTLSAIGDELGIGRPTVKTHVQHIYKKLGVSTRAEAVQQATARGWLRTGDEPR